MKLSFLLFAQVAYTANAAGVAYTLKKNKEDSSEQNSLRGGGATTDDENAHRSLYDVMGLAPGASGCSLHSDNDGTYICGVRSNHKVTDAGRSEHHLACVTDTNGSQKCAHFNLADGPGFPGAPPPGSPGSGFPGGPGVPGAMWRPSGASGDWGPGWSPSGDSGDWGPGWSPSGDWTGPSRDWGTGPDNGWTGPSGDWGPGSDGWTGTGGDCIGSAGYSWCHSLSKCIRQWETTCPSGGPGSDDWSGPSRDWGTGPDGYDWSPTGTSEDFGPGFGPGGYYSGSGPSGDYGPGFRPDHDGGLLPNQGGGRKCPTNKPSTGTHCCGWIPTNWIEESCYYNNGSTQCNCARQNNECGTAGWQCRDIP